MMARLLAVLCVLIAVPASAANLYVRDGGTGTCTTDWSNACDQISTALTAANRGDVIFVAEGTYSGITINETVSGTTLLTIKRATVADHGASTGWLDSYGDGYLQWSYGSTDGSAVSGGGATISGRIQVETNYILIDGNTDVVGRYGFLVSSTTASRGAIEFGTDSARVSNVTVRDTEMDGNGSAGGFGIKLRGDNLLASNIFTHTINEDPISYKASDSVVEHCRISDRVSGNSSHPDAVAFNASGSLSQVDNSTLRYCVIDWDGQRIFFDGTNTYQGTKYIYGNIITSSTGGSSAKCMNGQPNNPVTTIHFYNNTCANALTSSITGFSSNTTGVFYNNLFYSVPSPGFPGTHDYNWFGPGISFSEANGQGGSGNPFTNITTGDYSLTSATNPGLSLAATYATDMSGATRGGDGTWDRGAIELDGGGGSIQPTCTITSPTSSDSYATGTTPIAAISGECSGGTMVSCTGTSSADGAFTVNLSGNTFTAAGTHAVTADASTTLTVECTNDDALSDDDILTVNHTTPSGELPAQDSFTRSDSGSLGGNWTDQTASLITVASNQATGNGATSRQCAFWNANSLGANQYSQAVVATTPTISSFQYVTVRASGTGSTYNHYSLTAEQGVSIIAKIIDGQRTALQTITGVPWSSTDVLRIVVDGSMLRAYRNSVQIGTDQATGGELTSGQPGICLYGSGAADNFEGDELAALGSAPEIAIATPTTGSTYSTTDATVDVTGTCTDADGVASVTWTNSAGGSGTATGTTSWSQNGIVLAIGANELTFTCTDSDTPAQTANAALNVTRSEINPGAVRRRLRIR